MQDERVDRQEDKVEDLEVRGDEAREIAGGKKVTKKGAEATKKVATDANRFRGKI